jgi:hypothetical protein
VQLRRAATPRGRGLIALSRLFLLAAVMAGQGSTGHSHDHGGAPFPILVDQRAGPYLVSVWTAPDVGIGRFYVTLDSPAGTSFVPPTAVRIVVAPLAGRLTEATYAAQRERVRRGARFYAEVAFDRAEAWRVRVLVDGPAGGGELVFQLTSTPPESIGPARLALYSFPFVAIALLWWRVSLERKRSSQRTPLSSH